MTSACVCSSFDEPALYSTFSEKMSFDHRSTLVMLRPNVLMFCSIAGLDVQLNCPAASQLASCFSFSLVSAAACVAKRESPLL